MPPFSTLDLVALAWFVGSWIAYALVLEHTAYGRASLNALMNRHRETWMRLMLARDIRIVDTQLLASLANGTAFFASTSLIAIGGAITILQASGGIIEVVATLPLGIATTRVAWDAKTIGLAIVFVYAFFKFAWSYRLFNYVAIMLGAMPPWDEKDTPAAIDHAARTARLFEIAGRHFNRGQRAFFLALGYLGWFVGPWVFIGTTSAVILVMWRRQFFSESHHAIADVQK